MMPVLVSPWHFNIVLKNPFFCFIWEKPLKKTPFVPHTAQLHTHPSTAKPQKTMRKRQQGEGLRTWPQTLHTAYLDITHSPPSKRLQGSQGAFPSLKGFKGNKRQKSVHSTPRSDQANENCSSWACRPPEIPLELVIPEFGEQLESRAAPGVWG